MTTSLPTYGFWQPGRLAGVEKMYFIFYDTHVNSVAERT